MTLHATTDTETDATTSGQEPTPQGCFCPACGTDEFLVLRRVETCRLPGQSDTTGWAVNYRCSNCGRQDEHLTASLRADWDI